MDPTSTTNNVAEKGTNSNMSVDSRLNIENVTKATFILICILLSVKKKMVTKNYDLATKFCGIS